MNRDYNTPEITEGFAQARPSSKGNLHWNPEVRIRVKEPSNIRV